MSLLTKERGGPKGSAGVSALTLWNSIPLQVAPYFQKWP